MVGEEPYAEGEGDRPGEMGLDSDDLATIDRLRASGVVPVVVVLVSGRPLDIADELPSWDGLVAAWLPRTEGQGVADVLFGVVEPTGTLPVTWMRSADQLPINDGDGQAPLFEYGFGLGYEPEPSAAATPASVPGCEVDYHTNDWANGFTSSVSITNSAPTTIDSWALAFSFLPVSR